MLKAGSGMSGEKTSFSYNREKQAEHCPGEMNVFESAHRNRVRICKLCLRYKVLMQLKKTIDEQI